MAIVLKKGQKVDLTKGNPGLNNIKAGLGWDVNKYDGQSEFDLDVSVFMCDATDKVASDGDFIFYNNPKHSSESVTYCGDNRTGEGEGDDEEVKMDLSKIPANIEKIAFAVTIHEAATRNQNFGQVSNSYIRILNEENGEELIRYDLGEDYSIETAVVVGELYRQGSDWKFQAIGSGFEGGLEALCLNYGLTI